MGKRAEDFQEALQCLVSTLLCFNQDTACLQEVVNVSVTEEEAAMVHRLKTCRTQRFRSIQLRKNNQGTVIEGHIQQCIIETLYGFQVQVKAQILLETVGSTDKCESNERKILFTGILEDTDVYENFPKKHLFTPVIRTHFKILKPIYFCYKLLNLLQLYIKRFLL